MSTCILFLYVSLCYTAYMYITKRQKHDTYINVFHGSTPTQKKYKNERRQFFKGIILCWNGRYIFVCGNKKTIFSF